LPDDFVPDLAAVAHALASPESRVMIVGLFSAYAAGRAAGIGMLDFTQPLLRSCTAGVRLAFAPAKLVPCGRGAASLRMASTRREMPSAVVEPPSGMTHARYEGAVPRALPHGGFQPPERAGHAREPIWTVPKDDNFLLRLTAAILAGVSATIAAIRGRRFVIRRNGDQP
jgi:hypothetical protein